MSERPSDLTGSMGEAALGTILLIEDEATDSLLIRRAFEKTGVENPIQTIANRDTASHTSNESLSTRTERDTLCRFSFFWT
jgi:hypothetical protein